MPDQLPHGFKLKRNSKDSVFTKLFSDPANVAQLYNDIHPAENVSADDIEIITLHATLVNTLYNDLGFLVRDSDGKDKVMILVEAQSTWNENMCLRILDYLVESIRNYLKSIGKTVHQPSKIPLPMPEFYILYTGNRSVPDFISLNEMFFDGKASVDLKVKIFNKESNRTLYEQYIGFCHVIDDLRKIYGDSIDCVKAAIEECRKRGYLVPFLMQHEKEVITLMAELFDEEVALKDYLAATNAESEARGETKSKIKMAHSLLSFGYIPIQDIAKATGFSIEEINKIANNPELNS